MGATLWHAQLVLVVAFVVWVMIPASGDERFMIRAGRRARFAWALASVIVVETLILGLAALPAIAFWRWGSDIERVPDFARTFFLAVLAVPSYILFAAGVLLYSAWGTRLLGWRTKPQLEMRLNDFEWPVLDWGRYNMSIHVARIFAGPIFRASPVWALYMRWNGATIGRGVWVNSLALMDHNLLEFGDGVVIGSDARVSGHTVERGLLKTQTVRIDAGATIGVGSVVAIGSHVGAGTQVGALSVVPKYSELEPHAIYVGTPVRRLENDERSVAEEAQ